MEKEGFYLKLITLKNGFRIALMPVSSAKTTAIYLYIGAGNAFEDEKTAGASHFIEHLLFKGTSEFSDEALARKIDWLGGRFNAYTAKEYTCLYAHVLDESAAESLELIFKMVTDSVFPESAVKTERGVILEEINMYDDSPEDLAMDAIVSGVFADSPLRFNILGTKQTVSDFKREELLGFAEKYYAPERMVLSVSGSFTEAEIIELSERYIGSKDFTDFPIDFPNIPQKNGGIFLKEKDFEQTQILISAPGATFGGDERYSATALSSIAGGNASSRLNLAIRERLGLVYSVGTFLLPFKNNGLFMLSAGLSHNNQLKVLEKALEEMEKLPETLREEELASVRQQLKISAVMSNERITSLASGAGRDILYLGRYVEPEEMLRKMNALTLDDVRAYLKQIWRREALSISVVGKPEKREKYEAFGFKA